jgi:hypothetical protein
MRPVLSRTVLVLALRLTQHPLSEVMQEAETGVAQRLGASAAFG